MRDDTAPYTLRKATPADAPALAALHLDVWRDTYADLAPREAIEKLDLAHRLRAWQDSLADPERMTLVAERDGQLLGLVALGAATGAAYAGLAGPVGEIKHLYVARAARRMGLGARLMDEGRAALAAKGYRTAGLGVVRQNYAARLFYAETGGREVADFTDPGPLWRSLMVLVAWDIGPQA